MITIDGSQGEGGGQILRTSLALAVITGQACRFEKIRAGREKPGLKRQHLAAVEAAAAISSAQVMGAKLGSQELEFHPRAVAPGNYRFAVGSVGSATLVFQTVLPPLLLAGHLSTLTFEGGTHNPWAPPFDFLAGAFVPFVQRQGATIELRLRREGFYPAGGGKFHARIEPPKQLARVNLLERGAIRARRARALVAQLPDTIGERELAVVRERLGWAAEECAVDRGIGAAGAGNALILEIETEHLTAVFTAIGERNKTAEQVAEEAVAQAQTWLKAEVPVDEHLADQLLLPMALAGGGSFRTTKPSLHTLTNGETISRFLPVKIDFVQESALAWRVEVIRSV